MTCIEIINGINSKIRTNYVCIRIKNSKLKKYLLDIIPDASAKFGWTMISFYIQQT